MDSRYLEVFWENCACILLYGLNAWKDPLRFSLHSFVFCNLSYGYALLLQILWHSLIDACTGILIVECSWSWFLVWVWNYCSLRGLIYLSFSCTSAFFGLIFPKMLSDCVKSWKENCKVKHMYFFFTLRRMVCFDKCLGRMVDLINGDNKFMHLHTTKVTAKAFSL